MLPTPSFSPPPSTLPPLSISVSELVANVDRKLTMYPGDTVIMGCGLGLLQPPCEDNLFFDNDELIYLDYKNIYGSSKMLKVKEIVRQPATVSGASNSPTWSTTTSLSAVKDNPPSPTRKDL